MYDLLSDLLAPEKPAEKFFEEPKAILKVHYEPKPVVICRVFHYSLEESAAAYVAEL